MRRYAPIAIMAVALSPAAVAQDHHHHDGIYAPKPQNDLAPGEIMLDALPDAIADSFPNGWPKEGDTVTFRVRRSECRGGIWMGLRCNVVIAPVFTPPAKSGDCLRWLTVDRLSWTPCPPTTIEKTP